MSREIWRVAAGLLAAGRRDTPQLFLYLKNFFIFQENLVAPHTSGRGPGSCPI